jgi:hypothetical protein
MQLIPKSWSDLTPSDTVLITPAIGIYVGIAGDIRAAGRDGVVGTFQAQTGQYLIGNFTKVMATGTTATGLVALY